ncbi:MAG TPA: hypothetical protein P5080_01560 [Candidatus Paceibacterota bacterium]|nr:hypothetical protein [Candidatus Pacearchaeota archaeon]HRZ50724.1 hypothetical protein [Candidatus Paceibacterota bacterium]HSA36379.1 hypothetical protein [Candidatus Paceibacterota bacterium]
MNPDIIAYMALAGGSAALISMIFAAGTHRSSGTTKILGIFISVSFMAAGLFILIISALLITMQFGTLISVIACVAFVATISIIIAVVVIYRLFPDKEPETLIKKPARPENEIKEEKDDEDKTELPTPPK